MTPERWVRLSELFEAALDREPAARAGFLASVCPDDHALRDEVERLIEAHERAGDFGATPAGFSTSASPSRPAPSRSGTRTMEAR
jgi:eukaryotic-like serine/threonine-protein kinase